MRLAQRVLGGELKLFVWIGKARADADGLALAFVRTSDVPSPDALDSAGIRGILRVPRVGGLAHNLGHPVARGSAR